MGFDPNGNAVLPISHEADKALGRYAEAARFQEQDTDIAAMLSELKKGQDTGRPFDPSLYYTKAQIDAQQNAKQDKLGYIPINSDLIGAPNGLAPLGPDRDIPSTYLPSSSAGGGTGTGVDAFNNRSGNVNLRSSDVTQALGFVPSEQGHTQPASTVIGLQGLLDGKQDGLGFVPAQAVHTHTVADITGLGELAGYSTSANANETSFPIGHMVAALDTAGTMTQSGLDGNNDPYTVTYTPRNKERTLYLMSAIINGTFAAPPNGYTTAAVGSALAGTWRSRGSLIGGRNYLFQRVS
jgi:hypothetical protein